MTDRLNDLDALAELMSELAWRNSGWNRHVNHKTGAVALFPKTATDVDAWEVRCQEMQAAQRPVQVEDKPEENTLPSRADRLRRSD